MKRSLKWLAVVLLAVPLLAILWILIFGWNWARAPLQRIVLEKTGRQLVIGGDLHVRLGWPAPHVHTKAVTFANPPWAKEKQMLAVDDVEFSINVPELFRKNLLFPEVRLTHPIVFLELAADGRKTWLLDRNQSDDSARIPIGRLTLDRGQLGYDDAGKNTSFRADISTQHLQANATEASGVLFSASGLYKGLTLVAHGNGATVLALHDDSTPYPLKIEASIGHTSINGNGTITSLLKFTAMDMQLVLRGESLADLFPLFGIALPETHAYMTTGRVLHSDHMWRYDNFSGHVGKSDIAGSMQIDSGGVRPFMRGELVSQLLDFQDLAPVIGAKKLVALATATTKPAELAASKPVSPAAPAKATGSHLLPVIPFKTERWGSVDAEVTLKAKAIQRAKALPLENLSMHLKMQNSLLTLDPLDFGFAGGHLKAVITMDGGQSPIQAHAKIAVRKLLLPKLFPTINLAKTSIGNVNGDFDLTGKGNSVDRMLATSNGRVSLVVADGEISKLLLEEIGLHLVEILQLKITDDKIIKLRCGVADFAVKSGIMQANVLLLDTEASTIIGNGNIDLSQEKLDLTLMPKTKKTILVSLRSPIYIKGTFAKPEVSIDKARVATRGLGALALGLINPLLILIPLLEKDSGVQSECVRLINAAQTPLPKTSPAPTHDLH